MEDYEPPTQAPGSTFGSGLAPIAGLSQLLSVLTWLVVLATPTLALVARASDRPLYVASPFREGVGWALVVSGFVLVNLAQLVIALAWMRRARSNGETRLPGGSWGPGWAVGAWMVPFAYLVLGYLVMRDIWHATFGRAWDRPAAPGWVLAGFMVWAVPKGILHVLNFVAGNFQIIGTPTYVPLASLPATVNQVMPIAVAGIEIVAAVFFLRFVGRIAAAQEQAVEPAGWVPASA